MQALEGVAEAKESSDTSSMGSKDENPPGSSAIAEAADETCEGLHLLLTNQFTAAMNKMRPK